MSLCFYVSLFLCLFVSLLLCLFVSLLLCLFVSFSINLYPLYLSLPTPLLSFQKRNSLLYSKFGDIPIYNIDIEWN